MPKKDLIGQRFGKLIVTEYAFYKKVSNSRKHFWRVICDCGVEKIVRESHLLAKTKATISCGCYRDAAIGIRCKTHGLTKTKTYKVWQAMVHRCTYSSNAHYKNYGGRGITVCDRWLTSIESFIEDMGEAPENLMLDRIDGEKGYYKENCRWATRTEQNRNKRDNRYLTINGETKLMLDWSRESGIKFATIYHRIKRGWTADKAVKTPARLHNYH